MAPVIINIVNIGQTIPSIAILALFMSILGLGVRTAVFALWLYSLLPILRNTYTGIQGVNPGIIEAARGMGMPPQRVLWRIEFPLALRVIMAGIRTAVVINVGTATLSTFIGAGGLGDLIITGLSLSRITITLTGGILAPSLPFWPTISSDRSRSIYWPNRRKNILLRSVIYVQKAGFNPDGGIIGC